MTDVLINREQDPQKYTQEQRPCDNKTEIGMMAYKARKSKNCWQLPETRKRELL